MKIYLTNDEFTYLYNMVNSSVEQLKTLVNTHKMLSDLSEKIKPPRNYTSLNREDRMNLTGICSTGMNAILPLLEKAEADKKEHLIKAKETLESIQEKLTNLENVR